MEEAWKVKNRVARFTLLEGILYRRGFFESLLRYLSSAEAQYVLVEIDEGTCGSHT